jgi:hypothetical protein
MPFARVDGRAFAPDDDDEHRRIAPMMSMFAMMMMTLMAIDACQSAGRSESFPSRPLFSPPSRRHDPCTAWYVPTRGTPGFAQACVSSSASTAIDPDLQNA